MTINDPISDMLTRIRNGVMAGHTLVAMPSSKLKVEIAKIMKDEGYLEGFEIVDGEQAIQKVLRLKIKYVGDRRARRPVISGVERVSTPGRRIYTKKQNIPWVLSGIGVAIISTPKGVMTGARARQLGVGGEILQGLVERLEVKVSRIGRLPVSVPSGVQVNVQGSDVHVKGPKGELKRTFSSLVGIAMEDNHVVVTRNSDNAEERALHGTTRAVIANMIHGVSSGFTVTLEIEGVGYRAEMEGKTLALHVGYSHPVKVEPPAGIVFETDAKTRQIKVSGFDREAIGQVAAEIRGVRPPEPYHGKGIRYAGEKIRRKAGKAGKGAK